MNSRDDVCGALRPDHIFDFRIYSVLVLFDLFFLERRILECVESLLNTFLG